MANRNTQLEIAPSMTDVVLMGPENPGRITTGWLQWFTKLRYFNSNENHQAIINAAGDINLDAEYVALTATTASYAITLAPPTLPGKSKIISMVARTNPQSVTLALTNVIGGTAATTATFDAVNETLILRSLADTWVVIKQHGVTLT